MIRKGSDGREMLKESSVARTTVQQSLINLAEFCTDK